MNISGYLSIITIYLIFGCGEVEVKTSVNARIEKDAAYLTMEGEKHFQLDSLSNPHINALSVFTHQGRNYFSFLKENLNRIYVYDMENEAIEYYVLFNREGPNGVGSAEGYHFINPDSILLLDSWTNNLSIIDKNGLLIDKYKISDNSPSINPLLPVPKLRTTNPVLKFRDAYFFTGYSIGEFIFEKFSSNRPVVISYDINENKMSYDLQYPEIYRDVSWGGTNYRSIYADINHKKNQLIISFPADHNLWFYNVENGEQFSKYAGSQYFGDITSFQKDRSIMDRQLSDEFFGQNPSYSSVVYDKYRDVYYRMADHPIQDYDESSRQTSIKKFSIIILDKNMEKVGETIIPHLSHSRLSYFISEDGLYLQKYQNNEDLLVYTLFKLNYE